MSLESDNNKCDDRNFGNDESQNPTEIRSPKIRKVLGDLPHSLLFWSLVVMVVILIALILAVSLLPFPYSNGESILQHIIRGGR